MSTKNNITHVRATIAVLKQFCVEVTQEEEAELLSLPTEERVDRWKRNKIKEVLNDDRFATQKKG